MYATNVLKFAHYSCILLNYIQTCLVYRDRLKKNVLTLYLITQEIKKKNQENYVTNYRDNNQIENYRYIPFQNFSINIFP